jgi:hypothetical protein
MSQEKNTAPITESIDDDLEIIGIFKGFLQRKEKLWIWQRSPDGKSQRLVHYAIVRRIDSIKKFIELRPNNTQGFFIKDKELPLFVFSNIRKVALKTYVRECTNEFLTFPLPQKLNAIVGDQLQDLELIERENEELHEHERGSPRIQAKVAQTLMLRRLSAPPKSPLAHYNLYDISQGGLSFEVYDPAEFLVDEKLTFLSLDGKPFAKELIGIVSSIRQLQEGIFKVGIKFISPQESLKENCP